MTQQGSQRHVSTSLELVSLSSALAFAAPVSPCVMLAQLSLRRAPLLGARLAPSLPVPCHAAAYTTAPPTSAAAVRGGAGTRPLAPRRTAAAAIRSALPVHAFSACRAASTSTSPSPLPAAAARPAPGGASTLSWNEFLNLRRARRRWSLVSSTITAAGFVVVGTGLGLDRGWDGIVASTIGLDPLVTMILCVAALAASGWLLGPAVGGTVHRYWYRHLQGQMAVVCTGRCCRWLLGADAG